MTILYSEKYLAGVSVFCIYSLVLILHTTYFGIILNSLGKTKFIFYSSLTSLALNAGLNFGFYYIFGFIGPALATFVSILLMGAAQLFFSAKEVSIKFSKLFSWAQIVWILLVNVILCTAFFIITKILNLGTDLNGIIWSVALGAAWLGIYFFLMRKTETKLWNQLNEV